MVDALSYSYKPPSSLTSPDCDGQDGNMDMLHLVQNLFFFWEFSFGSQPACLSNQPYLLIYSSFQSHRNIDARGGIFNDVGQNQYNCFVVNQYFTLNMQEPGDPVCAPSCYTVI